MSVKKKTTLTKLPTETIDKRILFIRGHRVILDNDLARIYGVSTKRLNEQVRRNLKRFPEDFMFRLTSEELTNLSSQIATSRGGGMRSQTATASKRNFRYLPYAFTEHGALMAANILNSKRAVAMSVYVIRAFVCSRAVFLDNQILQERLREIEEVLLEHDVALEDVHEKIGQFFLLSKKARAIDFDSCN